MTTEIDWKHSLSFPAPDAFRDWVLERINTADEFAAEFLIMHPCPFTEDDLASDSTSIWLVSPDPAAQPKD